MYKKTKIQTGRKEVKKVMKLHGKMLKKRLICAALCCILAAFATFFGFWGLNNAKNTDTAEANVNGTTISLTSGTGTTISSTELVKLFEAIGGSGNNTYSKMKTALGTGTKTATQINRSVNFGNMTWNVVYASTTNTTSKDVIATLWLATSSATSKWNNWYDNNTSYAYPSNMYSSSLIRSYLMGTPYVASEGASSLTNGSANTWSTFRNNFNKYLVTPSAVSWQSNESAVAKFGSGNWGYLNPNDAYGTPSSGSWYNTGMNYSSKSGYASWSGDTIWLPSITETGYDDASPKNGIWGTTATMRRNGTNSWLRSGYRTIANYAYYLNTSGGNSNYYTALTYAVRPALHLNLKSAASAAGLDTGDIVSVNKPTASNKTFNGSAQTLISGFDSAKMTATLSYNSGAASTVTAVTGTKAGTYTFKFKPKTGHQWSDKTTSEISVSATISALAISNSSVSLTAPTNKVYNGSAQESAPTLKLGSTNLVKDTDYTLSYSNNTNVGTATVTITGKGNYSGSRTTTYSITALSVANAAVTVTAPSSQTYTGSALTPAPTVKRGTVTMVKDTDYTLTYSANTNAGTATVKVTGKGNYNGEKSVTFAINARAISDAGVSLDAIGDKTYTGSALVPTPVLKYNSKTLVKDTDFTVSCTSNTNVGQATMTITGKGNYSGSRTTTFNIVKAAQTPVITSSATATYGANKTLSVSAASVFGAVTYQIVAGGTGSATISGNVLTPTKSGTVIITATAAGDANHNAGTSAQQTITIAKAERNASISYEAVMNYLKSQTLSITGNSENGAVTWSVTNVTGEASLSSTSVAAPKLNADRVGTVTVSATIAATENYNATSLGPVTVTIDKAEYDLSALSFEDKTVTYDPDSSWSIQITGGALPNGLNVSYTYNNNSVANVRNAGTYTVRATFTVDDEANYKVPEAWEATLTINKATPVINVAGVKTDYVYTSYLQTVAGGASVNSSSEQTVKYANNTFTTVAQGNGLKVKVYVEESANYAASEKEVEITVTKAKLDFKWSGGAGVYAPGEQHKSVLTIDTSGTNVPKYNDTALITNATLASEITIRYTKNGSSTVDTAINHGTYAPKLSNYPTAEPFCNYDYEIVNDGYSFEVTKATVTGVSFTDKTVTYNGKLQQIEISGTLPSEVSVVYNLHGSTSAFNGRVGVKYVDGNVAAESVDAVFSCSTGNYEVPETLTADLRVEPKQLQDGDATGIKSSYVYGGNKKTPKPTVSVLLSGNTNPTPLVEGVDYIVEHVSDSTDPNIDLVGSTVTVKVTGKENYAGTVEIEFTIDRATLGFEWTIGGAEEETPDHGIYTYDGAPHGNTVNFTGVAFGDVLKPIITYYGIDNDYESAEMPTNAGQYRVVAKFTADSVETGNFDNYTVPEPQENTFVIKQATPVVDYEFVSWNGTDTLWAGAVLPEIQVKGQATCNGVPVAGTMSWALVDGARPALIVNTNTYTWEFIPDSNNYEKVTGTVQLTAKQPTLIDIQVVWRDLPDVVYTSTTLTELKQYIYATGTLDNGDDFGEITGYDISGENFSGSHPNKYGDYTINIAYNGIERSLNLYYTEVSFDHLEVEAAEGKEIKKEYNALEQFDVDTIVVYAVYTDGHKEVKNLGEYTIDYRDGHDCLWVGYRNIMFEYSEQSETFGNKSAQYELGGLEVKRLTYDMSGIKVSGGLVDYTGGAHEATVEGEFTIGSISFKYEKRNSDGTYTVVDAIIDAGTYRVTAIFTREGEIYTTNYNGIDNMETFITVNKVDYEWASGVEFNNVTTDYAHGASVANKITVTGIPQDFTGVSYEYTDGEGNSLTADEVINAGAYTVKATFTVDGNHNPILPKTATLTVSKVDPILNPVVEGRLMSGNPLSSLRIINKQNQGTEGEYTWDHPDTELSFGGASYAYTFTPADTKNYKVKKGTIYIETVDKVLVSISATIIMGDAKIYTSTTVEMLQKMIDDGEIIVELVGTYMDGANNTTEETITVSADDTFYVFYLNDAEFLEAGELRNIGVHYNGINNRYAKVNVTAVALESIAAEFEQNGEAIFTSGDIETLKKMIADGLVTLTVEGTNNDGNKVEVEYELSGDWSAMTEDGKYSVTVTETETGISTTFEIDVTYKVLTGITAEFDQKAADFFESGDISKFEEALANGDIVFVVHAHYNDGDDVIITADDYTLKIVGADGVEVEKFAQGCKVVVEYQGEAFEIEPVVTPVLVTEITAKLKSSSNRVYTTTTLDELKEMLAVTAYYNDGNEAEITNFELSLPGGGDKLPAATQASVTVTYVGDDKVTDVIEYELIVGVSKHDTRISFTGTLVHVYDGEEHEHGIVASVNYEGAEISYELKFNGNIVNGYNEVGTYTLTISVEETDDYYGTELEVTIVVNKADYDLRGVSLDGVSVVYNGSAQSLVITGGLPAGVTVEYVYTKDGVEVSADRVISAGTYVVTAKFTGDTVNHNPIPDMVANLVIEKAEFSMDGVVFGDETVVYDGSAHEILLDESTLPEGLLVAGYTYFGSLTDMKAVNAGTYTVKVSFRLTGDEYINNYKIPEGVTAKLVIEKAEVEIDVSGMPTEIAYDGQSHTVTGAIVNNGAPGTLMLSNNTFTDVPEGGVLKVRIALAESANFKRLDYTFDVTVTRATLTITAEDVSLVYGEALDSEIAYVVDGLFDRDGAILDGLKRTCGYSQYAPVGSYGITLGGVVSNNYEIEFIDGTLTVSALEVTVNWNVGDYTYDGLSHVPTADFVNVYGDTVELQIAFTLDGDAVENNLPINAGSYLATASVQDGNYAFDALAYEFEIALAEISVKRDGDQWFDESHLYDGSIVLIELDKMKDGEYRNISFVGDGNTPVKFEYSQAYVDGVDAIPDPENESVYYNDKPDNISSINKYVVNYRITIDNHKVYVGQWRVEIVDPTEDDTFVQILFKKHYSVKYGSVPVTEEALAELAKELVEGGYVEVSGGIAENILDYMTVRVNVDNKTLADGATPVGRYTPYFVFKPEFEAEFSDYTVIYKADNYSENTNVGMFEIERRELTIGWSATKFVAADKLRLPVATVSGFVGDVTFEMALASAEPQTFECEIEGAKMTFTVTVDGDLTTAGGHTIRVSMDNDNFVITNPATTISITAPTELTVSWEQTEFTYGEGVTHLPVAIISGFADGKTVKLELDNAQGGTYQFAVNDEVINFTVAVSGEGDLLSSAGKYAIALSVDSEYFVINNPAATVTVREPQKLALVWNVTEFVEDGTTHLPKVTITGFKESSPIAIELTRAESEIFEFEVDGIKLQFTVKVEGDLKSIGEHVITLSVNNEQYVIEESSVTVKISEKSAPASEQSWLTPLNIGIFAAIGGLALLVVILIIVSARRRVVYRGGGNEDGFDDYADE